MRGSRSRGSLSNHGSIKSINSFNNGIEQQIKVNHFGSPRISYSSPNLAFASPKLQNSILSPSLQYGRLPGNQSPPNPPPQQPLPPLQPQQLVERNRYLEDLVQEYQMNIDQIQLDYNSKMIQLKDLEEKFDQRIEENQSKFKKVLEEKDSKIAKLEEEIVMSLTRKMIIVDIRNQLNSAQKKLGNYKQENEFLRQRIKKMTDEEEELKKSMNQAKATLQNQINSLIEQVNQSEQNRLKMAEQLKIAVGDKGSMYYTSLAVLSEQIVEVEKENERLYQKKNELEGQLKNLNKQDSSKNI
ncbi:hypothetical protein H8356DRAFT_943315 [Neocallimastix lanati (nom. inval.)]|nr:hypothetical protein H8356DRAFT_943315 [Neocallimastix sp. JGI-2020a]